MAKIILIINTEYPEDYQKYVENIRQLVPGIIATQCSPDNSEIEIITEESNGAVTKSYY